jgi:hypothetical protein
MDQFELILVAVAVICGSWAIYDINKTGFKNRTPLATFALGVPVAIAFTIWIHRRSASWM